MLALVRGLEALLEKGEITADSAVLGLRSSWVTVKTHRLPSMTKRELDRAVQFEIPDLVYFPVEDLGEVCYDYFINSRSDSEVEIVVAACPREHLAPYIDALRGVNLNLEIVDLPSFSWPELLPGEKRRAFVEITEDQTTAQVLTEGLFKVWRVVPLRAPLPPGRAGGLRLHGRGGGRALRPARSGLPASGRTRRQAGA